MSDQDKNRQFEQDLHDLYQAMDKEQPPAELDQHILQAAHKAVEKQSTVVPLKPKRRAWYVPLSYVAMIFISLTLVMRVLVEPDVMPGEPALPASVEIMQEEQDILLPEKLQDQPAAFSGAADFSEKQAVQKKQKRAKQELRKERESQLQRNNSRMAAPQVMEAKSPKPVARKRLLETETAAVASDSLVEPQDSAASPALPAAEDWLLQLLQLHEKEEFGALVLEMERFRQQYPDFPLPEALAAWYLQNKIETAE